MAFELYKNGSGSERAPATERFIASGAIEAGLPVKLVAGTSGGELGKVAQVAAGSGSSDAMYGIATHAAADGDEVLVIPAAPGVMYVVDAAADTNVSNVAADNYLATTTYLLTVGASTNSGKKCHIIGKIGLGSDRKYLVKLNQAFVVGA